MDDTTRRYIEGLIEQIARDTATLRDCEAPDPDRAFYEQRIAAYRAEVLQHQAASVDIPTS